MQVLVVVTLAVAVADVLPLVVVLLLAVHRVVVAAAAVVQQRSLARLVADVPHKFALFAVAFGFHKLLHNKFLTRHTNVRLSKFLTLTQ